MAIESACSEHPNAAAVGPCGICGRSACDPCARFVVDDELACDACGRKRKRLMAPRFLLAGAFFANALVVGAVFAVALPASVRFVDVLFMGIGGMLITLRLAMPVTARRWRIVERRPGDRVPGSGRVQGPYRAAEKRRPIGAQLATAATAHLSGRKIALGLGLSFGLAALLVPFSVGWALVVELELILLSWWTAGVAVLSFLLYRGYRIADDHRFELSDVVPGRAAIYAPDIACAGALEGGFIGLAIVLGLVFFELVGVLIALVVYTSVVTALGRVLNDEHGCEGRLSRALGWGALWATLHIAPLATLVWFFYVLSRAHGKL